MTLRVHCPSKAVVFITTTPQLRRHQTTGIMTRCQKAQMHLRFEVLGWQNAENVYASKRRCIWAFWHRVIIPVVWWRRNCGVVVMNTTAFDGQWTRKVIEWMGYGTAQGSSSRGGLRGL